MSRLRKVTAPAVLLGVAVTVGAAPAIAATSASAPSVPRHVNAVAQGATSVLVTWKAPAVAGGRINNYRIGYAPCPATVDCPSGHVTVGGSARRVLLKHLQNGVKHHETICYVVTVSARNADGYGQAAELTVVPDGAVNRSKCRIGSLGPGPTSP